MLASGQADGLRDALVKSRQFDAAFCVAATAAVKGVGAPATHQLQGSSALGVGSPPPPQAPPAATPRPPVGGPVAGEGGGGVRSRISSAGSTSSNSRAGVAGGGGAGGANSSPQQEDVRALMPELRRIATGPSQLEEQHGSEPASIAAVPLPAGSGMTPGSSAVTTPAGSYHPHPFLRHPPPQVLGSPAPPGSPAAGAWEAGASSSSLTQPLGLSASADWGQVVGGASKAGLPGGRGGPSPMRARRSTTGSVPEGAATPDQEAGGGESAAANSIPLGAATSLTTSRSKRFSIESHPSGSVALAGPLGLPPLPCAPVAAPGSGRLPSLGRCVHKPGICHVIHNSGHLLKQQVPVPGPRRTQNNADMPMHTAYPLLHILVPVTHLPS
jgi:hypothetical protein